MIKSHKSLKLAKLTVGSFYSMEFRIRGFRIEQVSKVRSEWRDIFRGIVYQNTDSEDR